MAVYKAKSLSNWLTQQVRLEGMIEKGYSADLQRKFWFIKWLFMRYTVGDFLNHLVSHDELHIDQARRALAAYEERGGVEIFLGMNSQSVTRNTFKHVKSDPLFLKFF